MRRLALLGMFALAAGGCGAGTPVNPNLLEGLKLDPAPKNGFQLILPIVRGLEPGSSHEICTWTDRTLDQDVFVKSVKGFQTETGHHAILFSTKTYQTPGTQRECTDDDMATFRFAVGSRGEGQENVAPGDLVYKIEKGAQIVVNHHYLNASPKVHDAQSALNVVYAEAGTPRTLSGALAIVNTKLKIPPGKSSMDIKCTLPREILAWSIIPHMHRWGVRERVELVSASDGKVTQLFDVTEWDDSFTFHPPEIARDPSNPFVMKKGDKINVHCEWNNTTEKSLTFGNEMCVSFAQTVDKENIGNIACDDGEWTDF